MAVARRVILAAIAVPGVAAANEEAVLELDGAIRPPAPHRLSLSQIDAFGQGELVTGTPWTIGLQHFSGLPMRRLLEAVGARGTTLHATALNDYAVEMPIAAVVQAGAFVATRLDGAPLPIRLRGPFWIVFPWSQRPQLDNPATRRWSIWQLQRLAIA